MKKKKSKLTDNGSRVACCSARYSVDRATPCSLLPSSSAVAETADVACVVAAMPMLRFQTYLQADLFDC